MDKINTTMRKDQYKIMFDSEEELFWYQGLRDILYRLLSTLKVPPRTHILDAGCGTGKNMTFLQSQGFIVSGVDISKEAVKFCHKRGITDVIEASIVSLPFYKNNSFDVIICVDVLGLLSSDHQIEQTCAEFYRILKPGGHIIIQCAAFEWLRSSHDAVTYTKKRFSKKELAHFFKPDRFKTKKLSYRVFFLFLPIAFIKLIKKMTPSLHVKPSADYYITPRPINILLTRIQQLENLLCMYVNFPFGTSLLLVAEKK